MDARQTPTEHRWAPTARTPAAAPTLLNNAEVGSGGSDYTDNTVVTDNAVVAAEPEPVKQQADVFEYPFLYYLLEVRRGGSRGWNATRIISRRQQVVSQPAPEPEPEIAPAPAFRGPAPRLPHLNRFSMRPAA